MEEKEERLMEESGGLRPITVRFPEDAWRAIKEIADEHGISQAELVRMAVVGNLWRYLGDLKYIDREQGEEIKTAITALLDTISKIQFELHRIGINYNQEIKLRAIERKYAGDESFRAKEAKLKEEFAVKQESKNLSKDELDAIMKRYEVATKEVGEVLCRILA